MLALVVGARFVLAVLFAVSSIAKLRDIRAFRLALAGFGLPAILIEAASLVVALTELAVASLLVPAASAWWGGVAALALLLLFSGSVLVALTNGRRPDCHCFGQIIAAPISPVTLLRNAGLAACSVLVVLGSRHELTAVTLPDLMMTAAVLSAVGAVLLGSSVQRLMRRRRVAAAKRVPMPASRTTSNRDATDASAPDQTSERSTIRAAPAFVLPTLGGGQTDLARLLAERLPVVLVFISPDCRRCRNVEPRLAEWQHQHRRALTIAVVTRGGVEKNQHLADRFRRSTVLLQHDREVARAYGISRTPAAILIAPDGTLASAPALDVESIAELVAGGLSIRRS